MNAHAGLARWQDYMRRGHDPAVLRDLLAEGAVFHSPVVHTPQVGKAVVMAYLVAAAKMLGNDTFRYTRELVDEDNAMLEFVTEIDGIAINGADIIRFDTQGRIAEFKVMVRPLKAVNKVWDVMAAQLAATRE